MIWKINIFELKEKKKHRNPVFIRLFEILFHINSIITKQILQYIIILSTG